MKKHIRKIEFDRTMFLSLLALLLALVLIPVEIFAWFAIRNDSTTEDFELDVIGESESGGTISVFLPDGSAYGSYDTVLLPGESVALRIVAKNISDETRTFKLSITDVNVTYPTAVQDFAYPERLYGCPDYFTALDARFDVDGVMTEQLFRRFVAPVSNAIRYDMYYASGDTFAEGYESKYFTTSNNATSADLAATDGVSLTANETFVPISTAKPKTGQTDLGAGAVQIENGITVNADGTLTLASEKELELYLIINFDAEKYVSADIGDSPDTSILTLRNSNPYLQQKFAITMNFENSVL